MAQAGPLPRRALLAGAGAAALSPGMFSPGMLSMSRAATAAPLTVAGFAGPFQAAFEKAVIAPFRRAHPEIGVTYAPILNSAQLLAMLRLERDAPGNGAGDIDVAIMDISVSILATGEGLLAPLPDADVPNRADLPEWSRDASTNGLPFSRDNLALICDGRALKELPSSWADLGRPDLVDQVCMPVQDTRGVALLPILTRMQGGDYRLSIDPGLALMKRFAPGVASWNAQPDIYTLVLAQTVALGVGWNARGRLIARRNPGTIRAVIPREGSVTQINMLCRTAKSARAAAAGAFIDHALSVEVQTAFATLACYGPANTRVSLPEDLSALIFGTPDVAARELPLDWRFVSAHYAEWIRRIQREVISG